MSDNENIANFMRYGCYHVALGRVMPGSPGRRTAAIDDIHMDHPAANIDPVRSVIAGARSYADSKGLDDPHEGIDYHKIRTNRDLISGLAHAYDALPEHDPAAVKHFHAMRDEVHQQYDHMTNRMGIRAHFVDHDPYRDVHDLARDVRDNHQIQVLKTAVTGHHPLFSDEDNDKFRAVHDLFGHLGTGRDFDRHGEEAAYQAHARMFSPQARGALASETRGQNGSLIANDRFGPQKIALMPRRLWHPGLATTGAMIDDFRSAQHDQWLREQRASGGNDTERKLFYDPDNGGERQLNLRDWMGWHKQDKHPDEDEHVHEYGKGYDLGRAHGEKKWINSDELAEHTARSPHPGHFGEGYQMGLEHALSDDEQPGRHRVAVLLGHNDRQNEQLVAPAAGFKRVVAHVSGNSIDVLHCFAGETRYLTRSGVKSFAETVGTTQWVLTSSGDVHDGEWVQAPIRYYGDQQLWEVALKRNKRTKVIRTTAGHRWLVGRPGAWRVVTTDQLKPEHRLAHLRPRLVQVEANRDGIREGIMFGDGSVARRDYGAGTYGFITLWGEKAKDLAEYFEEICPSEPTMSETQRGLTGLRFTSGMIGWSKELPLLDADPAVLRGWLMGYLAADGAVDGFGKVSLSSAIQENLEHARMVALRLGVGSYGVATKMREGYGTQLSAIHSLAFATSDLDESWLLRTSHREKFSAAARGNDRFGWTVTSVRETDDVEPVYCAEVADTESFALEDNIWTKNCPFCGSGALIARSDGTIECNYCTAVFTVQVQPQFPAFPMTSQGQPYAWPGQPDPATVVSPGGSPMAPGDPMATGPGGAPGDLTSQPFSGSGPTDGTDGGGSDGPPWADGGDGDDDADDDPTAQIGGKSAPPFGKGKKSDKSDKKDDGKKGDNPFAKKKSYLTATGAVLDEDEYIRHLAIAHADDPARMASRVRAGR